MADRGSYTLGPRLDIQQLFLEAQHRWLRPAEICEILRNYQKFQIASEPPSRPPSGSLFLFDRKVLRYFRKDGHNWRKKKDGKTVKEAHEKLKVGSVDVLHCYYAHGEDNESFQRRSYWMLEQQLMHIVFVHYLEVKGNRTNNSPSNSLISSNNREPSGNTDSTSSTSPLASFCEDTDSADSQQVNAGRYSFLESQKMQNDPAMGTFNTGSLSSQILNPGSGPISYYHGDRLGNNGTGIIEPQNLTSWEEVLEQYARVDNSLSSHLPTTSSQSSAANIGQSAVLGEISVGGNASKEEFGCSGPMESRLQVPFESISLHLPVGSIDRTVDLDLAYDIDGRLFDHRTHNVDFPTTFEELFPAPSQHDQQFVPNNNANILTHAEPQLQMQANSEKDMSAEDSRHTFILKQPLLDRGEALKKVDSFSRWATKELGEVDDLHMRSSSGLSWSTVECGNVVDDSTLSPSLSQDQLFSITDFSPKWAYADSKTEVHICGRFLQSQHEVEKYNWSCMFGEVEVPAEILADGILCCYAPPHNVATVPFYVTGSNRVACSEVREFDYRVGSVEYLDVSDVYTAGSDDMHLHLRFERLLSVRSSSPSNCLFDGARDKQNLVEKIMSLKEEGEGCQVAETTSERCLPQDEFRKLIQKTMQEKLYAFLLHVVAESGKGPSMLDDGGQSVLHLAAALGYDWAIKPIIISGVSINFRDVNGWTGLHWAAFFGREQTVAALVSLGADTRALTDPSPESPLGRTPADLASGNGHKGISGFLAESSLTSYLHLLTLSDKNEGGAADAPGLSDVQTISERMATPESDGDVPTALSFKDTLTAMRNATQAANRIYQVFRMQSFQRKRLTEYEDDEIETLDPRAVALLAAKAPKPVHSDGVVNAAATQIQKKYRGWKKRKEFLIIRQRIVKIQAHVRGHQVRKQYKTVIWSVGILEKVILRWRRKGSGLRGFRRDALPSPRESSVQFELSKEDDYDFLKEGRKQNEVRQQKALTRVKSMYHSSEGQAQYRRLLNYFEKFRETKGTDMVVSSPNEMAYQEADLIDIDSLLDDDTFMSIAFE